MPSPEAALPTYLRAAFLSPMSFGALALGLVPALLGVWPSVLLPALLGVELVLVSLLATSAPFRQRVDVKLALTGQSEASAPEQFGRLLANLPPAFQARFGKSATAARSLLQERADSGSARDKLRAALDDQLWALLQLYAGANALERFLVVADSEGVEREVRALERRREEAREGDDEELVVESLVAARARLQNATAAQKAAQRLESAAETLATGLEALTCQRSELKDGWPQGEEVLSAGSESAMALLAELSYMTGREPLTGPSPRIL